MGLSAVLERMGILEHTSWSMFRMRVEVERCLSSDQEWQQIRVGNRRVDNGLIVIS